MVFVLWVDHGSVLLFGVLKDSAPAPFVCVAHGFSVVSGLYSAMANASLKNKFAAAK